MTPLLVVRNLCSAVTQSGYFKHPALKKSLRILTSFFKDILLEYAKWCPGETHKVLIYFLFLDDTN